MQLVLILRHSNYVKEFQDLRKTVDDTKLKSYMTPRKLEWKGNPNPTPKPEKAKGKKDTAKEAPKAAAESNNAS